MTRQSRTSRSRLGPARSKPERQRAANASLNTTASSASRKSSAARRATPAPASWQAVDRAMIFTDYANKSMMLAEYELVEDLTFFGSIPGIPGVRAGDDGLEACRDELKSVLGGWLILKLWDRDDDVPLLGKLSFSPQEDQSTRRP